MTIYTRHLATLLLLATHLAAQSANHLERVDSLLKAFDHASAAQRADIGRQLMGIYEESDVFFTPPKALRANMPADSVSLAVWFGATRYYKETAYFAEGLYYADRALPLTAGGQDDMRATLLCDKGYMLFKIARMEEATAVEHEAVQVAQRSGNRLQLSRAYLYLAIVNHVLQQSAKAMQLVEKSIAIDRQMGHSPQAHNTLGVACEIYSVWGQLEKGEAYGLQAVEAARANGDSLAVANHLSQLSYTYDRMGNYDRGISAADYATKLIEQCEIIDRNMLALTLEYKAYNLIDQGHQLSARQQTEQARACYEQSVEVLRRAMELQTELGNTRSYCTDLRTLAEALTPIDSTEALQSLAEYAKLYDSVFTSGVENQISKADAQLRNDELASQNSELNDQNARLASRHRLQRWLLWSMVALVVVLAISLYRFRRSQQQRIRQLLQQMEHTPLPPADDETQQPAESEESAKESYEQDLLKQTDAIIHQLMPLCQADINHVASALCLSPSQFRRKIQTATGLTPGNYILIIRMNEAKRLLSLYPKYSVSDIAQKCGFADNAHFTHAFNRLFGMSPMQFIGQQKNTPAP